MAIIIWLFFCFNQSVFNRLILLTILCVLTNLTAYGYEPFWSSVQSFEQTKLQNLPQLLVPSRNLQLKHYYKKTSCVAVVFHGLFQSPKDMQTLINNFHEKQCNVVAPLLAGHWRKNSAAFDKINFNSWKQQGLSTLKAASQLGEKIILVGHSTGGLLAFSLALEHSKTYNITGLVLFSPALKLTNTVRLFSKYGSMLGLNSNSVSTSNAQSEYDMQLRPAVAGLHVQKFIDSIFQNDSARETVYKTLHVPTLLISTENDVTIDHTEVVKMQAAQPNLFKLIKYQKDGPIQHDNIQRTALDLEPNAPKEWSNPFFADVLSEIEKNLMLNP